MKQDWDKYYQKHANREPRKLLVEAVSFCQKKEMALELGAGALTEARYLLKEGFEKVIAIDDSDQFQIMAGKSMGDDLEMCVVSFHNLHLDKEKYNLVSAQFSLPFYGPDGFPGFVKMIVESLKPGGIFVGQFFGVNDSWNVPNSKLVFHTKKQISDLLSDLEMLKLEEVERDIVDDNKKNKHWHIYNFIVKKT